MRLVAGSRTEKAQRCAWIKSRTQKNKTKKKLIKADYAKAIQTADKRALLWSKLNNFSNKDKQRGVWEQPKARN